MPEAPPVRRSAYASPLRTLAYATPYAAPGENGRRSRRGHRTSGGHAPGSRNGRTAGREKQNAAKPEAGPAARWHSGLPTQILRIISADGANNPGTLRASLRAGWSRAPVPSPGKGAPGKGWERPPPAPGRGGFSQHAVMAFTAPGGKAYFRRESKVSLMASMLPEPSSSI